MDILFIEKIGIENYNLHCRDDWVLKGHFNSMIELGLRQYIKSKSLIN